MTNDLIEKIKTLAFIVKTPEQLPYGNKSRGRYIKGTEGRRDIFVPSFGSMEKEEVDYVAEVAREQEDERIKRKGISAQKLALETITGAMRQTPRGKRAEIGKKIIKEAQI